MSLKKLGNILGGFGGKIGILFPKKTIKKVK